MLVLQVVTFTLVVMVTRVSGHGKMVDPPGRNTVMNPNTWGTYRKACPERGLVNYSDKGMFCGGRLTQHENGGKCGACGDNYADSYPRNHDFGGTFATDITPVRAYRAGQVVTVRVLITASHLGSFQFRVCPRRETPVSGDILTRCFSDPIQHIVLRVAETGATNYTGPHGAIDEARLYEVNLRLPDGLTCPNGCSLQWWYRAGNNPEPTFQEHFVNCADILILTCDQFTSGNHADWCAYGPTEELMACRDEVTTQRPVTDSTNEPEGTQPPPTTSEPWTNAPTTTPAPTTEETTTKVPTTDVPTTEVPSTDSPTTEVPSTDFPTTQETTEVPTTSTPGGADEMTCDECVHRNGFTACSDCCSAQVFYKGIFPAFDSWCTENCPAYCPDSHCVTSPVTTYVKTVGCDFPDNLEEENEKISTCEECTEAGQNYCDNDCCSLRQTLIVTAHDPAFQVWCEDNCNRGYCPESFCTSEIVNEWQFSCERRLTELIRDLITMT